MDKMICSNKNLVFLLAIVLCGYAGCINAQQVWPDNKVAVSLSYDDSLNSQLDNALPVLNSYGLKASFYVLPSSDSFQARFAEWREVAKTGHELGNHTLKHSCSGSKQNREWVTAGNDLDTRTAAALADEVKLANRILFEIDGQITRTFTIPCGDSLAGGENYIEIVANDFVAVKGQGMESGFSSVYAPDGDSGEDLIRYLEEQASKVRLINVLFHGVGGDYLSVSSEAHAQLLKYLTENSDRYWVDTYLNIIIAHESSSNQRLN